MAWLAVPKHEETNEWETLLKETGSKSDEKGARSKTLVCLGDGSTGKRTLLARLANKEAAEEVLGGNALSYSYMEVHTDEADFDEGASFLNLWAMPSHEKGDLLEFAINKTNVANLVVVIAVNLAKPHAIDASLKQWSSLLEKHLEQVFEQLPANTVEDLKANVKTTFQLYTEPEAADKAAPKLTAEDEKLKLDIPLPQGVLTHNLGIPIIVCACKADALETLMNEQRISSEQIDFIQAYLRRFCLRYGAALVYSSQAATNQSEILREYVVHRAYGLPLKRRAQVLDKSTAFVPWGWDSERRITDTVPSSDQPYFVMIPEPDASKHSLSTSLESAKVEADDDLLFLQAQKEELDKFAKTGPVTTQPRETAPSDKPDAAAAARKVPSAAAGSSSSSTTRRTSAVAGLADKAKTPSKEGGPPSDEALVNFFHSLLNRDKGAATGASAAVRKPSITPKPAGAPAAPKADDK